MALCRFINEKITVSDNNLHITELLFPIREFSQMRLPLKINQRQYHLWPASLFTDFSANVYKSLPLFNLSMTYLITHYSPAGQIMLRIQLRLSLLLTHYQSRRSK